MNIVPDATAIVGREVVAIGFELRFGRIPASLNAQCFGQHQGCVFRVIVTGDFAKA